MKIYISFVLALALPTSSAFADTDNMPSPPCIMQLDMNDKGEVSNWRTVLDGVMGGRSTGNRFSQNRHMVFKGSINTNGGGFSSIRRPLAPGSMDGAEALRLRVRQDGRAYRLTFRTNARFRGRSVSYQIAIPQTRTGEWSEMTLPLTDFRTSIFGYEVTAASFDAAQVQEMGIILADGIDGPFQIEIAEISCVQSKAT